jgi:hypothetical protein
MPARPPFPFFNNTSFLGSVTRSEAWYSLESEGFVKATSRISKQESPNAEPLSTEFAAIKTSAWTEEVDMYPDVIKALKSVQYSQEESTIGDLDGMLPFSAFGQRGPRTVFLPSTHTNCYILLRCKAQPVVPTQRTRFLQYGNAFLLKK